MISILKKCVFAALAATVFVTLAGSVVAKEPAADSKDHPAAASEQKKGEHPKEEQEEHTSHDAKAHNAHTHKGHVHDLGHGDATASQEDPAEFRTDLALYTLAVFFTLLTILGKLAWPAIATALFEREQHIEGQIAAAEAKHEEAKQLLAQHEAKLASAADEVREMLEEARRDAEVTKETLVKEAGQKAEAIITSGKREVRQAADAAMSTLAETSANLAVSLAGKVVQQNLSAEQQAQVVKDAVGLLASAKPSQN